MVNNKIYIGKTRKTLELRKRDHINKTKEKHKLFFHRALLKYGLDNFKWEVLKENVTSDEYLCRLEREYIKFFNSNNREKGYNLTEGGDGVRMKGWKHKKETKLKIGRANKGLKRTSEQKDIIKRATTAAMKKYVFTKEQLRKSIENRNIRKNSLSMKILSLLKNKSIKNIENIKVGLEKCGVFLPRRARISTCLYKLLHSKRVIKHSYNRYKISTKGIKSLNRLKIDSKRKDIYE